MAYILMDETQTDPLAPERAAYLAVSRASIDAILDAKTISETGPPDRALAALRHMAELQTAVLVAHDRFVRRADEIGLHWAELARLREGRAALALQMQRTLAALRCREQGQAPPP